jgi:hypothetical protein
MWWLFVTETRSIGGSFVVVMSTSHRSTEHKSNVSHTCCSPFLGFLLAAVDAIPRGGVISESADVAQTLLEPVSWDAHHSFNLLTIPQIRRG